MTYEFRHATGESILREFDWRGEIPKFVRHKGKKYNRVFNGQPNIAEQHKADYYAGREGAKRLERMHRTNKEVAEGLASGKMMDNPERPVISKDMTQQSVSDFNNKYNEAKGRTSSPIPG